MQLCYYETLSHGLINSSMSIPSKSFTFRVASLNPPDRDIEAI